MRSLRIGVIAAMVSLGLLFVAYPWPDFYHNSHHGAILVILSYLLVALMVGLIVAASAGLASLDRKMTAPSRGSVTVMASFSALFLLSMLMGPMGLSIPGTAVSSFFVDFEFAKFTFQIAFPISLLAGGLVWWAAHREEKPASAFNSQS